MDTSDIDRSELSRRKFLRSSAVAVAAVAGGATLFGADIASALGCNDYVGPAHIDDPVSFDSIGGVGFFYGTNTGATNRHTYTADRPFKQRMESWVGDLKGFSETGGRGALQKIGGAGLASSGTVGCHPLGQAFDLNWIQWGLGKGATYCKPYAGDHEASTQTRRRLYLAVDAVTRMTFKFVLDGWVDGHSTHIHLDMSEVPKLDRSSKSDTLFVKAVCNRFNGASLDLTSDVWTDNTTTEWKKINEKWGYKEPPALYGNCNPTQDPLHYRAWLALVARHGFADKAAGFYQSGTC